MTHNVSGKLKLPKEGDALPYDIGQIGSVNLYYNISGHLCATSWPYEGSNERKMIAALLGIPESLKTRSVNYVREALK